MGYSYSTKVKIDTQVLEGIVEELKKSYEEIGTKETHEGRSRFSVYNNIKSFYDRLPKGERYVIIPVTGESKGGTARIYFKPSVTSLGKQFRKCIVPINEGHMFLFTDLRAAEFALAATFAQEVPALQTYQRGEDIYMSYKHLFPEDTPRAIIKKTLIANVYNKTAYSTGKDLGISEAQAQRILDNIARNTPRIGMMKRRVYLYDKSHNGYFAPRGLDQTNLIKVADIDPVKGFSYDYAISCYVQSALGFLMQDLTTKLLSRVNGTFISVFDSVLIEHNPENSKRLEDFLTKEFSPLLPDSFTYGSTFWDAAYGKE